MKTKNFKEDLDFKVVIRDREGVELPLPWWDFRIVIRTDGCRSVTVWRKGEHWEGCFADGGRVHVVLKNHGLGPGVLRMEMLADLPDGVYPDGKRLTVVPEGTDIELVVGKGDWPTDAEVELTLGVLSDDLCRLVEEVNAQLDRTLGGPVVLRRPVRAAAKAPAVVQKAAYRLDDYVTRGVMSVYARPGKVYHNHGKLRIPVGNKGKTFDLSRLIDSDSGIEVTAVYVLPCSGLREPSGEIDWDIDSGIVTVTEDIVSGILIVDYDSDESPYVTVGADGKLRLLKDCPVGYRRWPKPTPNEVVRVFTDGCPHETTRSVDVEDAYYQVQKRKSASVHRKHNGHDHNTGAAPKKWWSTTVNFKVQGVFRVRRINARGSKVTASEWVYATIKPPTFMSADEKTKIKVWQ